MTAYYLLIIAGQIVDASCVFYKVSVGQTKKDTKALQKLQFVAKANAWFLQKFDLDTTLFYRKIADSLGKKVWQLHLHQEHVVTLLNRLESSQWMLPDDDTPSNISHLRYFIDTDFRIKQKNKRITLCRSERRKKPKVSSNTPLSMGTSLTISNLKLC